MRPNITDTTTHAGNCRVIYRDESGATLTSNHATKAAALRYVGRVLAVRHYGPFTIVDR